MKARSLGSISGRCLSHGREAQATSRSGCRLPDQGTNADGSNQVRLSDAFGQIADWLPDGRYVVFEDFERRDGLSLIRSEPPS